MCDLKQQEIEAMTDTDLADYIKSHYAGTDVAYQEHPDYSFAGKHDREHAYSRARTKLNDFVRVEAARGQCDPVRFAKKRDEDGFDIISARTYVLSPAVVEEIERRLRLNDPTKKGTTYDEPRREALRSQN